MLDVVRFCQRYRIEYAEGGHHHCHNGWVQIHCPFCAFGMGGYHLGFSLKRGTFNCWRCGPKGFTETIALLLRIPPSEVKAIVQQYQTEGPVQAPGPVHRPENLEPPPNASALHRLHRQYLQHRKYDPDQLVQDWGLSGTQGLSGMWNWRVIIPIQNSQGAIVAYQGRAIGPDVKPKYKMTDEADCLEDPRTFLYGLHRAHPDQVLVVEGVTGVWRLGPGAVATLGIDWKREQANQLRRFRHRYILFDPEPLAQQRALQLAQHLSAFGGETEILSGFTSDPGDLLPKQARHIRQELGFPEV